MDSKSAKKMAKFSPYPDQPESTPQAVGCLTAFSRKWKGGQVSYMQHIMRVALQKGAFIAAFGGVGGAIRNSTKAAVHSPLTPTQFTSEQQQSPFSKTRGIW